MCPSDSLWTTYPRFSDFRLREGAARIWVFPTAKRKKDDTHIVDPTSSKKKKKKKMMS